LSATSRRAALATVPRITMSNKRSFVRIVLSGLGSAALVVISVVLALVALEFAMRSIDGVSIVRFPNFIATELDIIRSANGWAVHDPLLGWRLSDHIRTKRMTTGAYGLRMNSNSLRDPPQHAILAVGDSFTAGSGVVDADTWPAQLERAISTPVVNAGAGGYSVAQMLLRAENLAPILHPRVIIVGILSQDIPRDAYDIFGGGYKPWFKNENGKTVLQGVPVPEAAAQVKYFDWSHAILGHSYLVHKLMIQLGRQQWWLADHMRHHQAQTLDEAVAASCALMDRLARFGRDSDARIIVVFFWGVGEVMIDPPAPFVTPVLDCARQAHLAVLDLYGVLRKIGLEDPARFKTLWVDESGVPGHPSAEGNAITARELKERFFD
jgi:hypothetical protein